MAAARAAKGNPSAKEAETLLSVENLKMYFPVTQGIDTAAGQLVVDLRIEGGRSGPTRRQLVGSSGEALVGLD